MERFETLPNHLLTYLSSVLGHKDNHLIETVRKRFYIGNATHWPGATVFWQIDRNGLVRAGKVILYDPESGKRIKEPFSHITWVHSILKKKQLIPNFHLEQCLFGEHQLGQRNVKQIGIVESEKTAIIATIYLPELTWMACGSLNGLNANRLRSIQNIPIILYPDIRGYEIWALKAKELKTLGFKISISNILETSKWVTSEERANGLDLADYLTRFPIQRTKLDKLLQKYPFAKLLVERLDLQLISNLTFKTQNRIYEGIE